MCDSKAQISRNVLKGELRIIGHSISEWQIFNKEKLNHLKPSHVISNHIGGVSVTVRCKIIDNHNERYKKTNPKMIFFIKNKIKDKKKN